MSPHSSHNNVIPLDEDARCWQCNTNIDCPDTELQRPCPSSVFDPEVICVACCLHSDDPCAKCLPARPNHPAQNKGSETATGRAGGIPFPPGYERIEIDICNECDKIFEGPDLFPVAVEGGTVWNCWPCIEHRRDLGLSA